MSWIAPISSVLRFRQVHQSPPDSFAVSCCVLPLIVFCAHTKPSIVQSCVYLAMCALLYMQQTACTLCTNSPMHRHWQRRHPMFPSNHTHPWNKRNSHLETEMRICTLAHAHTTCMQSHRHSRTPATEISKLECKKGGAQGPPANLMHGDQKQNKMVERLSVAEWVFVGPLGQDGM